ncbi:MAG: CotH kinase family protein [Lachnospiraceae bacterium]|nr:CotH kinase family protein [Lachnospiraceae bacterium]
MKMGKIVRCFIDLKSKKTLSTIALLGLSIVFFIVLNFSLHGSAAQAQEPSLIYINEICAKNSTIDAGGGNYFDWIELFNAGSENCDISGYGLSDSDSEPYKYKFADNTVIPAQGYLLVYCDKKAAKENQSIAGFGLSTDGDSVFLSNTAGTLVDSITFGSIGPDVSYGRLDTDKDQFFYFDIMSPEGPNIVGNILVNDPVFSNDPGFYDSEFNLNISCDEGCTIYYTLDGSTPTTGSYLYNNAIRVYDVSVEPNVLASYTNITANNSYSARTGRIDKAMVINAIAVNSAGKASNVITGTYFVGSNMRNKYSDELVISLVTDKDNLFSDDSGIYVLGNSYDSHSSEQWFWKPANYHNKGKEWERPAAVQVFSKSSDSPALVLSENIGIRIHGGASRAWPQKSFSFYARSEYGASKLEYDFYQNDPLWDADTNSIVKFDSIMIRNAGNDNSSLRLRDKLNQKLIEGRDVALQGMTPAIVFINGEYWGHYEVTEKLSDYYIQSHYGVDEDNVSMVKNNEKEEGSDEAYQEWLDLCSWVKNTDFSDSGNYAQIAEKIDIQSFIDYISFEIYIANDDWGTKNKAWWKAETVDPSNPYADGKWRFIVFDTEYSDSLYSDYLNKNAFSTIMNVSLNGNQNENYDIFILFRKLMGNADFKRQFCNTFLDIANYNFDIEKVNALIDQYSEDYERYTIDYHKRFENESGSFNHRKYQDNLETLIDFFENRYAKIVSFMKTSLSLSQSCTLVNVTIKNDDASGKITLNTISPSMNAAGSWTGKYYTDFPVHVKAAPEPGKVFLYYEVVNPNGGTRVRDAETDIVLTGDTTVTAVYGSRDGAAIKGMPYKYDNGLVYDVSVPHIVINQVYGGKKKESYASHSFIELYNPTDEVVDLTGWSLQYRSSIDGGQNTSWSKADLSGTIPAHCSYLVRCRSINNPMDGSAVITDYDLQWDQIINNKGCSVVLVANTNLINADAEVFDNLTGRPLIYDYVDMAGVSGNDTDDETVIAKEAALFYEKAASQIQSKKNGIRRKAFRDTDDNSEEGDFEAVDYSFGNEDYIAYIFPKCTADGPWEYNESTVPGFNVTFVKYGNVTVQEWYRYTSKINKPEDPERTGYTFTKWFEDAACTTEFSFKTKPVSNIALYAGWEKVEYPITYIGVDGAENSNPVLYTIESGDIVLSEPQDQSRSFAGWYDNAEFTGTRVTKIPAGSTGAVNLYARWKIQISFTKPAAFEGLVYNAQDQALVTGGSAAGGDLYFALKTDESTPKAGEFTTEIPKAVNAGRYYVWFKAVGDEYHLDTEPAYVLVNIARASVTVSPNNGSKVYGDADPTFTASVNGLKGNDKADLISYRIFREEGENAGSYKISSAGEAVQGNYDVVFASAAFTVTKAEPALSVKLEGWTAGGQAGTPSVTGNSGNGKVEYSYKLKNEEDDKFTVQVPSAAGSYTVRAVVAETENYKGGEARTDFVIAAATGGSTTGGTTGSGTTGGSTTGGGSTGGGTTGGGSTGGSTTGGGTTGGGTTGGYTGGGTTGGYTGGGTTGGYTGGGTTGGSTGGSTTGGSTGGITGSTTGGSAANGTADVSSSGETTAQEVQEQKNKDGSVTTTTVKNNDDGSVTTNETTVNKDGSSHGIETTTVKNGYVSKETNIDAKGNVETITTSFEKTNDGSKTLTVTESGDTKITETVNVSKNITTTETVEETPDSKTIATVTENKKKNTTVTETVTETKDSKITETITETKKSRTTVTVSELSEGITTEKIVENSKGTKSIDSEFTDNEGDKLSISGKIYRSGKTSLNVTEESKDGSVQKSKYKNASDSLMLAEIIVSSKSVVIPSELAVGGEHLAVTTLGKGFLSNGGALEKIELGASVTTIEPGAFNGADNLKEITITAGKIKNVPKGTFEGIPDDTVFTLKATKKQYKSLKKLLKKSGLAKTVKFKRLSPDK